MHRRQSTSAQRRSNSKVNDEKHERPQGAGNSRPARVPPSWRPRASSTARTPRSTTRSSAGSSSSIRESSGRGRPSGSSTGMYGRARAPWRAWTCFAFWLKENFGFEVMPARTGCATLDFEPRDQEGVASVLPKRFGPNGRQISAFGHKYISYNMNSSLRHPLALC